MLDGCKFTTYRQRGIWEEAANTAMLLKINLLTPNRTLSTFQHFFCKGTKLVLTLMQKFGEVYATNKNNTHWA